MQHKEIAKKLFVWNSKKLTHDANLNKSEIGDFFAESFLVIANGRTYDANHDNYFEFLNEFRSSIESISYKFGEFIVDRSHVVVPKKAKVVRTDGSVDNFEVILILKFDQNDKIILWHEVYVKM